MDLAILSGSTSSLHIGSHSLTPGFGAKQREGELKDLVAGLTWSR